MGRRRRCTRLVTRLRSEATPSTTARGRWTTTSPLPRQSPSGSGFLPPFPLSPQTTPIPIPYPANARRGHAQLLREERAQTTPPAMDEGYANLPISHLLGSVPVSMQSRIGHYFHGCSPSVAGVWMRAAHRHLLTVLLSSPCCSLGVLAVLVGSHRAPISCSAYWMLYSLDAHCPPGVRPNFSTEVNLPIQRRGNYIKINQAIQHTVGLVRLT